MRKLREAETLAILIAGMMSTERPTEVPQSGVFVRRCRRQSLTGLLLPLKAYRCPSGE
jgi:hypothetical protein